MFVYYVHSRGKKKTQECRGSVKPKAMQFLKLYSLYLVNCAWSTNVGSQGIIEKHKGWSCSREPKVGAATTILEFASKKLKMYFVKKQTNKQTNPKYLDYFLNDAKKNYILLNNKESLLSLTYPLNHSFQWER